MFNIKHISVNLLGSALPILIIIFTVPLYLHAIGAEKYGALSLVWAIFGYFGILDFGVSRAVTNALSRSTDRKIKAEIIWSATALSLAIGCIIAIVAGAAFLAYAHNTSSELLRDVVNGVPAMMLGIPVLMMTSTLNGALDGEERFKLANALQLVGSILYQIVPLGVAYYVSDKMSDLIIAIIGCRVLLFLLYLVATIKVFNLIALFSASASSARSLLKFGGSIAAVNILSPIFSRVDQVVIARLSGTADVAAYSVAVNSIGRLGILPLAMSRSIFPKLSTGTLEDHRDTLFAAKKNVIWVWFALCVAAILVSDTVYDLWLRNSISDDVSDVAKVFTVGLWANCLAILPYTALQAGGRSMSIFKAHCLELPFYLALLAVLTYYYGAIGAAVAFSVRSYIDYIILWKFCDYPIRQQSLFTVLMVVLSAISYLAS